MVMIHNFMAQDFLMAAGDRCAQLIVLTSPFIPSPSNGKYAMVEVHELEFTGREGGFGSTGRRSQNIRVTESGHIVINDGPAELESVGEVAKLANGATAVAKRHRAVALPMVHHRLKNRWETARDMCQCRYVLIIAAVMVVGIYITNYFLEPILIS